MAVNVDLPVAPTQRSALLRASRAGTISLLSILAGLAVWELAARTLIDPYFLPPVSAVFLGLIDLHERGLLLRHISISMFRILEGWLLGSLAGRQCFHCTCRSTDEADLPQLCHGCSLRLL